MKFEIGDFARISPDSNFAKQIKIYGNVGEIMQIHNNGWMIVKFKNGSNAYREKDLIKLSKLKFYEKFM